MTKTFYDRVEELANSTPAKNNPSVSIDENNAYLAKISPLMIEKESLVSESHEAYEKYNTLYSEFEKVTKPADQIKKIEEMTNLIKPIQAKAKFCVESLEPFKNL